MFQWNSKIQSISSTPANFIPTIDQTTNYCSSFDDLNFALALKQKYNHYLLRLCLTELPEWEGGGDIESEDDGVHVHPPHSTDDSDGSSDDHYDVIIPV